GRNGREPFLNASFDTYGVPSSFSTLPPSAALAPSITYFAPTRRPGSGDSCTSSSYVSISGPERSTSETPSHLPKQSSVKSGASPSPAAQPAIATRNDGTRRLRIVTARNCNRVAYVDAATCRRGIRRFRGRGNSAEISGWRADLLVASRASSSWGTLTSDEVTPR